MSRPQFYRRITSITGKTPSEFLRSVRLEKALIMLRNKTGNVTQVALEVGYGNPSYFAKCFSEKFGCLPSEVQAVA
jgi:AraC-like DNA-binding protein